MFNVGGQQRKSSLLLMFFGVCFLRVVLLRVGDYEYVCTRPPVGFSGI